MRTPSPARVLIVDDSATMRRLIRNGLESDPRLEIVGEASDADEARAAVKALNPDVMTLDIEMPGMNGLEFLRRLMQARPMPVVMMSSLTAEGSDAALKALSLGAVDCFEKPRFGAARDTFRRLAELLATLAQSRPMSRVTDAGPTRQEKRAEPYRWNGRIVLIGASTGGVEAIETVLSGLPDNAPPTLVTQHMPAQFLESFAKRLDAGLPFDVAVAGEEEPLRPGRVLIAPGGDFHLVLGEGAVPVARRHPGPKRSGHRPSVDEMFLSAVPQASRVVAALLTGMGRDGAEGLAALRRAGALCIGQDEASSIVYGMPREAHALGAVEFQLGLNQIAGRIVDLTGAAETARPMG